MVLRHYSDPIEESITITIVSNVWSTGMYNNGVGYRLGDFGFSDVHQVAIMKMIHNFAAMIAVIGLPEAQQVQPYDLVGHSMTSTGVTPVTPPQIQSLIRLTITHRNGDPTVY